MELQREKPIHICKSSSCWCSLPNYPRNEVHLHSSFSSDGVAHVKEYAELAKKFGHPAMALTDHGAGTGLYDFYRTMKENGIKPILGCEFYLTTDLTIKLPNRNRELVDRDKHQTVLIKNTQGYKNFCRLNYISYTEGFYYKPRVSYDQLFEYKDGLIITSGCAASMFNQLINSGNKKLAEWWFKRFVDEFGGDFYGEIQFNELQSMEKFGMDQKQIDDFIIEMSTKYSVPLVIAGDVHYANFEDSKLQDIVLGAQRRKTTTVLEKEGEESYIHARNLFYHSSHDFFRLNEELGYNYDKSLLIEAFQNSLDLANKVNFEFETGKVNFPKIKDEKGRTADDLIEEEAWNGLVERLEENGITGPIVEEYEKRLTMELEVIKSKQFSDYFLIVKDLLDWCRKNNIGVGVARGSAGGALLSWCLRIIGINPIQHGLYFERFLNPSRSGAVDIDLDIEQGGREKCREYLEQKYGKDSVFGVVTFHIYKAKSAIQDASRGLGLDTTFTSTLMNEISKLEKFEDVTHLRPYFDRLYELPNTTSTIKKWIEENEETIKWADKLMGQTKNLGTHAGGILITDGPIYNHIPVARGGGEIVTAFKEADGSSKDLSELGLLKLDVLGLKTLNVINRSIEQIKVDLGVDISFIKERLDLEDQNLYNLIKKGNTWGIFQLESNGAKGLIKSIEPDCFTDIAAINALNRPGPLETFGPVFGRLKRLYKEGKQEEGKQFDVYPKLDFMQNVLENTYGCLIFQEQFMFMAVQAADFNLGDADSFRRAVGWRTDNPKYHTVKKHFDKLETGMVKKGYSSEDVDYFLNYCREFMGYSFNLSHSVAYSYTGMQCVYLKHYYPAYFYANSFNVEAREDYQDIVTDAIANNIKILPPSFTKSDYNFKVEDGGVRIGLRALNGLGDKAYTKFQEINLEGLSTTEILQALFTGLNTGILQCFIDAGLFDEYGLERNRIEVLKELYKDKKIEKWFTRKKKALLLETMPESLLIFPESVLFEKVQEVMDKENPALHLIEALTPSIKVTEAKYNKEDREKETLGFSLALGEKLTRLQEAVALYPNLHLKSLTAVESEDDLAYWYLINKTTAKTKTGKTYWVLEISDKATTVKAKCWSDVKLKKGSSYLSHLKRDKWGYSLVVDSYLAEMEF